MVASVGLSKHTVGIQTLICAGHSTVVFKESQKQCLCKNCTVGFSKQTKHSVMLSYCCIFSTHCVMCILVDGFLCKTNCKHSIVKWWTEVMCVAFRKHPKHVSWKEGILFLYTCTTNNLLKHFLPALDLNFFFIIFSEYLTNMFLMGAAKVMLSSFQR